MPGGTVADIRWKAFELYHVTAKVSFAPFSCMYLHAQLRLVEFGCIPIWIYFFVVAYPSEISRFKLHVQLV